MDIFDELEAGQFFLGTTLEKECRSLRRKSDLK